MTLRKSGSRLEGHPMPMLPWVDVATGSLGQGLPIGVGIGLAGKYLDKLPYRIWVVLGDSEMAEGSIWEALELGGYYKLNNLIGILDMNRLGQRGADDARLGRRRLRRPRAGLRLARHRDRRPQPRRDRRRLRRGDAAGPNQPTLIVASTIKGKGFSEIENKERLARQGAAAGYGRARHQRAGRRAQHPRATSTSREDSQPAPSARRRSPCSCRRMRSARRWRRARPMATRSRRWAPRGRRRRGGRRGEQLDLRRDLRQGLPRPLLRAVHRRAADGRLGGRACRCAATSRFASTFAAFFTRAYDFIRMAAISHANIQLCGSHAGVSIGEDGPSQMASGRPGDDARGLRQHRALSQRREPDGASWSRRWPTTQGISYLRTTREKTPVIYQPRREVPRRRQPRGAPVGPPTR